MAASLFGFVIRGILPPISVIVVVLGFLDTLLESGYQDDQIDRNCRPSQSIDDDGPIRDARNDGC
jgi:hypothetical protein